ncbi:MAG: DotI/IcmL family type IV secretion protein [Desulfobacteraceae bacterium]|nr:DotI/IcmL family type IV secretion protein [Desulfobacteraceae bacterium]
MQPEDETRKDHQGGLDSSSDELGSEHVGERLSQPGGGGDTDGDQGPSQETDEGDNLRGAAVVMESRGWYRDKFRQVVTICMILTGVLGLSFAANMIQAASKPDPVYFAVSDDLRIKQLTPLNEPSISQSALFNWTTRTITKTFSLDFVHWREQVMSVKPEYTEDCFKQLVKSLQNAGNLDMIRQRRLVLSAVVKNAPSITAKGVINGHMAWKMEFPISLSYESSERVVATQDLLCSVMVRRVSVLDHPRGVRLAQLVLK